MNLLLIRSNTMKVRKCLLYARVTHEFAIHELQTNVATIKA